MNIKRNNLWILVLGVLIFSVALNIFILSANNPNRENIRNDKINEELKLAATFEWNVTWSRQWADFSEGVAVDSHGNVYVVGTTDMSGGNYDLLIVKYDGNGSEIWNRTWGYSQNDWGQDIVIDGNDNIYVAGSVSGIGGMLNVSLIKFDSEGNQKWNTTWGGSEDDEARAIAVDSDGYIYVAGDTFSYSVGMFCDIILLKYNSSGDLEWDEIWHGLDYWDFSQDMVIDKEDNIYIVGYNRTLGETDIIVLKYDTSGKEFWNRTYGAPSSYEDGLGIATDSSNNVFITGSNGTSSNRDMILLKLNTGGDILLLKKFDYGLDKTDEGKGIAIDSLDNIYVVGESHMDNDMYNLTLFKFNSSGHIQWNKTWGGDDDDYGYGIYIEELTSIHNIYVVGDTYSYSPNSNDDILLTKFVELYPRIGNGRVNGGGDGDDDDDKKETINSYPILATLSIIISTISIILLIKKSKIIK